MAFTQDDLPVPLHAAAHAGCSVVSTEINSDLVDRARRNIAANGAPIEVLQTRFFAGLEDEEFDCVVFNVPYVPRGCSPVSTRNPTAVPKGPPSWRPSWA